MRIATGATTIRRADEIWYEQVGWYDARCHLCFDRYRDPEQMELILVNTVPDIGTWAWR